MIDKQSQGETQGGAGLPSPNRKFLWVARLVILVAFLDLFMQFPIIAPFARNLGASGILIGLIVAVYSATNLLGNLAAGVMLDRLGRRIPVIVGLISSAISLLSYVAVQSPSQLLVIRAIHGLSTSSLTPGAFAILGDSSPADKRAQVMGVSGAVIAIAAIVGPAIAGILGDKVSPRAVFLLSSLLMLSALGRFWSTFKEQHPRKTSQPPVEGQHAANHWSFLFRRRLIAAYATTLALTIGLGTLVSHLPLVLSVRGESAFGRGLVFSIFAVVAMITMASPLNRISDRYGRSGPAAVGLAFCGAGMLVLSAFIEMQYTIAGMSLFGAGFGILFPSTSSLVAETSHPDERGKAFGIFYAVFSLGVVAGSVASGVFAQHSGETTGAPFFAAAVVALLTILVTRIRKRSVPGVEETA